MHFIQKRLRTSKRTIEITELTNFFSSLKSFFLLISYRVGGHEEKCDILVAFFFASKLWNEVYLEPYCIYMSWSCFTLKN